MNRQKMKKFVEEEEAKKAPEEKKFESSLCCVLNTLYVCKACKTLVCNECIDNMGTKDRGILYESKDPCNRDGAIDSRGLHWWEYPRE